MTEAQAQAIGRHTHREHTLYYDRLYQVWLIYRPGRNNHSASTLTFQAGTLWVDAEIG
jgi:hypothetical protein